jgi:hypothetical protein
LTQTSISHEQLVQKLTRDFGSPPKHTVELVECVSLVSDVKLRSRGDEGHETKESKLVLQRACVDQGGVVSVIVDVVKEQEEAARQAQKDAARLERERIRKEKQEQKQKQKEMEIKKEQDQKQKKSDQDKKERAEQLKHQMQEGAASAGVSVADADANSTGGHNRSVSSVDEAREKVKNVEMRIAARYGEPTVQKNQGAGCSNASIPNDDSDSASAAVRSARRKLKEGIITREEYDVIVQADADAAAASMFSS